ncbi:hypothetical protein [Bacteroides coprosuis]|uniref:hypothetical protein n=1 Tax=Bacteroides coprosuis TaxID=151276 RepID=UPI001D245168|nr:hypothetical protein [Bacteroides coprosuis]HJD91982.1 hypothetical protein [Bacteroides coprosuis]
MDNKRKFLDWAVKHHQVILKSLKGVDLKVGEIVNFENEYGIKFYGFKVLGFDKDGVCSNPSDVRCVYLDWDSFWFPAKPSALFK